MPDSLTALTAFAVSVFRDRSNPKHQEIARRIEDGWFGNQALRDAQLAALIVPNARTFGDVVKEVFADPGLVTLGHKDGELDPMVLSPSGGMRMGPDTLLSGLLTSAFLQIHYLRLPLDEGTFVRGVLENFDELRRATRGEPIRVHKIFGIAGVTLPEGKQVSTPWGVMRPAPLPRSVGAFNNPWEPQTSCLLTDSKLWRITFDRAPQPKQEFDPAQASEERTRMLFPLACALASSDAADPAVPILTWSTPVLPFQSGFSLISTLPAPRFKRDVAIGGRINELEEWARTIEGSHTTSIDIAARRLVSAAGQRLDRTDALIDAVMVWENLVGTETETTFRVTAALAKALEPDRTKRRALRKTLSNVYNVRSRVVHGAAVEQASVNDAASQAIDVAIRALRLSYKKGRDWLELSSTERADSLLLEEP